MKKYESCILVKSSSWKGINKLKKETAILYLTPTPIGNYDDITLRALSILKEVDFIICEEYKPARRLLSHFNIDKELISLNEHNEKETAQELANKILTCKSVALISDNGSPLISDPGYFLIDYCISYKINIVPLPGANSITTALIASGLNISKFYYYGWLSPKKNIRKQELNKIKKIKELLILMETPYRLLRILEDILKTFGEHQQIVLAYNLTMPDEKIFRDSVSKIYRIIKEKKLKGVFVLLVNNR
ncbi:MAG: 16S rRNA (cytidine(1402)-2'-O)-methyltransferase [Ignavibacteriae bacterium]|nr:MAG: 16S rRNA (cytidine(1402)-2'-O)-methyltransferase [Ignavibacteriota bacterium]